MKKLILNLFLVITAFATSQAQVINPEEDAVKATINNLFNGMRNTDTTLIRSSFAAQNTMQTIAKNREGKAVVITETVNNFIKTVGSPHPEQYDERIEFAKILIDGNLASVWTNYKFYIGNKFSHCGVNSFQLFKGVNGWKIIYLIDTRRKENCNP